MDRTLLATPVPESTTRVQGAAGGVSPHAAVHLPSPPAADLDRLALDELAMCERMADLLGERTHDVALDPDVHGADPRDGRRSLGDGLQPEDGEVDEPELQ